MVTFRSQVLEKLSLVRAYNRVAQVDKKSQEPKLANIRDEPQRYTNIEWGISIQNVINNYANVISLRIRPYISNLNN